MARKVLVNPPPDGKGFSRPDEHPNPLSERLGFNDKEIHRNGRQ
ncbi:hypothetical protein [Microbulbifer thermotolerans]|uniref:Uncharacterized protein n=1 Tax=Microbulbifer thermotolerans TaxID=252514 RepID=A0AB35HX92_MICTH|nr:hypothetical protein [Microbulbifer thermotolerans]MCX2778202.1 hypothetical protein [Microbulbifer thermotolerans]MCX2795256.1 hypothetical protein [Microbulbifer thermotolerans]MCX2801182.1 hypothetical protein [Microbulbifer thermotolerans]MCX2804550.1 hypothetical protein [Microbulbifer thermotolerans]MCX2841373.1 hypothetical protein [Microbulbifer thermotolerans]